MEAILLNALTNALAKGDIPSLMGYALIFYFLWKKLGGVESQLKNLVDTISKSFAKGEARFEAIETEQKNMKQQIELLLTKPTGGALNAKGI